MADQCGVKALHLGMAATGVESGLDTSRFGFTLKLLNAPECSISHTGTARDRDHSDSDDGPS